MNCVDNKACSNIAFSFDLRLGPFWPAMASGKQSEGTLMYCLQMPDALQWHLPNGFLYNSNIRD